MTLVSFLVAAFLSTVQGEQPTKGDNAAIVYTGFSSTKVAMEYVVKEVLLPMDIIPLRADVQFGYIVTERVRYKGDFNCDYVFSFLNKDGLVQIRCRPRDYSNSKSLDAFSDYSMSYRPEAMKDSPVAAYWIKFQQILLAIPATKICYHGSDEDKMVKEFFF